MADDSKPASREERLNPEVVSQYLDLLREKDALEEGDREYLVVHGLARMAEKRILPRTGSKTAPLQNRPFGRCLMLAVDAVVKSRGTTGSSWFAEMRRVCREFAKRRVEVEQIADLVVREATLTPRQEALFVHWFRQRGALGLRRDWGRFKRVAERVCKLLGLPATTKDVSQALLLHRQLTKGTPGDIFVTRDGRLVLGWRQFRDRQAKTMGVPRPRGSRPKVADSDVEAEEDPDAVDALEAVAAVEFVSRLREVVQRRLEVAEPGSGRYHVLSRFEDLEADPEFTFRKLGEEVGMDHSALARAYRSERAAILRALGVSEEK